MNIDLHLLYNYLMTSREEFIKSMNNTEFDDTREYYSGLADGMLNVMDYINDNKDYLIKKDDIDF